MMEVSIVHAAVGRLIDVTLIFHNSWHGIIILLGQSMHIVLLRQDTWA